MSNLAPQSPSHLEAVPAAGGGLESGVVVGDFCIERRLGAGGMGIVYQARQVSLNRPVALKVLGQALTRGADVSRFQREAQAAARLKHPAIAQVYYIGQDRHLCYLAMELIEGVSLRRVLDRLASTNSSETGLDSAVSEDLAGEPEAESLRFDLPTEAPKSPLAEQPPPAPNRPDAPINPYLSPQARQARTSLQYVRRCAEIARDAAEALAHAHEQGVVHRDIKPDNLLLDRKGKLHLIDFGVARFFEDQAVTYTGQLVGTPLYMSPEQVTGRGQIDGRTDVYSLGLVLYELLTLRSPIEATNRENLLRTIITKPLPPISWRNNCVPPPLEQIVHRATQKDPDLRYPTASEMAADLNRFLAGKPVLAPPYHFRLDEREITAARPGSIVLSAFIYFITGVFLFMVLAGMGMLSGAMVERWGFLVFAAEALMGTAFLAVGICTGRGLLAARPWAWWAGIFISVVMTIACAVGIVGAIIAAVGLAQTDAAEFVAGIEEAREEKGVANNPSAPSPFAIRRFLLAMVALYGLPLVLGLVMGLASFLSLISLNVRAWFRFAREIRWEHRRLRESLG